MDLRDLLDRLEQAPETVEFGDTIAVIDARYQFTPTPFRNGDLMNEAGKNSGSCKIFSFGLMHGLSQQQTLNCFGAYYRTDVLNNPLGTDHQNIRNFMRTSWAGVAFDGTALHPLPPQ
jgi:hypothetical protein